MSFLKYYPFFILLCTSLFFSLFISVEELVCLAIWKEGSTRYLVGKLEHRVAKADEDKFRCFVSIEPSFSLAHTIVCLYLSLFTHFVWKNKLLGHVHVAILVFYSFHICFIGCFSHNFFQRRKYFKI